MFVLKDLPHRSDKRRNLQIVCHETLIFMFTFGKLETETKVKTTIHNNIADVINEEKILEDYI